MAVLLALAMAAAHAQGPAADWQTITTPHFRVHYPAAYQAWSERAASRLESIRCAVVAEVGYDPPAVIDVIVANPIAQSNGLAWPLLDAPRIVFYTEPPGPDEQIGAYSDWIDLLAVHEIAHIVHMLRPSRNPLDKTLETLVVPFNPITLGAPRWVIEGYATALEGRLTGAGRPSSTIRAAILRKWAASGRLPSYSALNSDSRFLGMSMAYLAGSAYLEWLEQRSGPESLRRVWIRMTARKRRSFDDAFTGVFGESPQRLYARFTAELTASSLAVERSGRLHEGELWQETTRATGDPAASPDGNLLAVVVRARNTPARLVAWSTGEPEEELRSLGAEIVRLRRRDPEDTPPVQLKPLTRKPIHSFTARDGGDIEGPRWLPGGAAILYSHRQPDAEGFLHHDLFVWSPATGDNQRLTRSADVKQADPAPDGRSAVAVRSRQGLSQLVRVDLRSGAVTELTPFSLDSVDAHPRISPDGRQMMWLTNRRGVWTLMMRDMKSGHERAILRDPLLDVSSPEWNGEGEVIATVSSGGFAELQRIRLDGTHEPLTRSSGGAFQPAPAADGRIFFMGLEPDGFVVRVLDGKAIAPPSPPFDPSLVPALPGQPSAATEFASGPFAGPRPYGIGHQEVTSIAGGSYGSSGSATELGVRVGDVVGRLETLAIGSVAHRDGFEGAAVAAAWRGWPVALSTHLFSAESRTDDLDGGELRGSWRMVRPTSALTIEGGAMGGSPEHFGFLEAAWRPRQLRGSLRMEEELRASAEAGSLRHASVSGAVSLRAGALNLGLRYRYDRSDDESPMNVGGMSSSLLPRSALPTRIFDPALPAGLFTGRRYNGARVQAALPGLPIALFYQQHKTDAARLSLVGAEVSLRGQPYPLLRLPAYDLAAGVSRIVSGPMKDRTRWWFGLKWRP